jgi:hypothetical protein
MNIMKKTFKVLRIETFLICLSAVLMIMIILEVNPISLVGFVLLIGSLLLLLLIDAWIGRTKKEFSQTEGFRIIFIFFILGLFLLFSPLESLQRTNLDSYNIISLLLGIALLLTNSFLLVALWVLSRSKSIS